MKCSVSNVSSIFYCVEWFHCLHLDIFCAVGTANDNGPLRPNVFDLFIASCVESNSWRTAQISLELVMKQLFINIHVCTCISLIQTTPTPPHAIYKVNGILWYLSYLESRRWRWYKYVFRTKLNLFKYHFSNAHYINMGQGWVEINLRIFYS